MNDANRQFIQNLRTVESELQNALMNWAKSAQVTIGAAATDKFMRDARALSPGDQRRLGRNPQTGPGSLRIVTGRLARSLVDAYSGGQREGISRVTAEGMMLKMVYGTSVPYAAVNELGWSGNVPAHRRRITQAFGRPIAPREVQVRSFFRNQPARPFLNPAFDSVQGDLRALLDRLLPEAFAKVATIKRSGE